MTVAETPVAYVEAAPEGGLRVVGSRVSLTSVVHGYLAGQTAEQIQADFPSLSLEQVYGCIAFYLRNREVVDQRIADEGEEFEALRQRSEIENRDLLQRLRDRRSTEKAG